MATLTPAFSKGHQGNTGATNDADGIGLDDQFTFQIKVDGMRTRFRNPQEDVSGFGDGGSSVWEPTGVLYGSAVILGRVLTNGAVSPASLGTVISSTQFRVHGDTVKNQADFIVEDFEIDESYTRNVPIILRGNMTSTITHTQA